MADGFCRGRAIWSAKFVLAERISAEAERLFPGSTGTVGPFRYENFGRSRPFFPGSRVALERFLSRNKIRPSTAIPSRLDRDGRPDGIARPKFLLRVRGQCFGADCVFTPFSPSILS
ncbi:unnamed protein product [Microthlaspi erraticum]|uniref:Uncharacterized protein n=1 Tax=Microthlaspi erraticum TaxID=1685480 RepID=A0A6D2JC32_9BRAS|nr:unnamed protein product [Microthlaspi erraticum]